MGEPSGLDFLSKSDEKNDADEGEPEESDSDEEHNEDESSNNAETPADNCEEEKLADDIAAVVLNDESAQPGEPNKVPEEDERSPQEVMDELLERAFLQGRLTLVYIILLRSRGAGLCIPIDISVIKCESCLRRGKRLQRKWSCPC